MDTESTKCKTTDNAIEGIAKAAMQLNASGWLQKHTENPEKFAIVNSLIYANFNYFPSFWHFYTCESISKSGKIQKCCLRMSLMIIRVY